MAISDSEKRIASLVVNLQFSKFWRKHKCCSLLTHNSPTPNRRSGKPMTPAFDALQSMGTCIKLFTTIPPIFFQRSEKVKKTEILRIFSAVDCCDGPRKIPCGLNTTTGRPNNRHARKRELTNLLMSTQKLLVSVPAVSFQTLYHLT